ncbi:MAG: hypothetical protein AAF566_13715 [Pseudomonadota bacterium]
MSDIAELERRITAALDRVSAGLSKLAEKESGSATLADELAEEREANAQLEERVRAIKEKQETMVASLQNEVASLRGAFEEADANLRQLRSVNAELRASNTALRLANASGLADPDLVNGAMAVELENLKALEAGTRAEIDRALELLEPMLAEATNA